MISAYLLSRADAPRAAHEIARVASAAEASAEPATDDVKASAVKINAHIREVALRYGVSPLLVAAIIEAESEFNPRAVSRRGARGLMQLMPRTSSSLRVEDTFDPYENIEGGVRHLRRLMVRFNGNLPLVLAAYNAGAQTVLIYGGVPPYPETRRYVVRILRRIGRPDLATSVLDAGRVQIPTLAIATSLRMNGPRPQELEPLALATTFADLQRGADEWRAEPVSGTDRRNAQGP